MVIEPERSRTGFIGIIGAGKLGTALAQLLEMQNRLIWIIARSDKSKRNIADYLPNAQYLIKSLNEVTFIPETILVAVEDSAIRKVDEELADVFGDMLKGKYILHFSGAYPAEIMENSISKGAFAASIHPFQAFYNPDIELFKGIYWGVDAGNASLEYIAGFIAGLGGTPHFFNKKQLHLKPIYHAAAVVSANYFNSIMTLARSLSSVAGIKAEEFLPPIIQNTCDNFAHVLKHDSKLNQTGPLIRGDLDVINQHFEALIYYPDLMRSYACFTLGTLEIALSDGTIQLEQYHQARELVLTYVKQVLK